MQRLSFTSGGGGGSDAPPHEIGLPVDAGPPPSEQRQPSLINFSVPTRPY
eukprot:NODE_23561_length_661_cov_1.108614.p4 GENE.NODE_23561_length_661_cov_1.108614~~NODE_23561_length_661_cov_1.108614.p4  ORF type:complete len:50 (-),score=9.58 NODE_23561_length_661_cov_1.108614:57-206(-)